MASQGGEALLGRGRVEWSGASRVGAGVGGTLGDAGDRDEQTVPQPGGRWVPGSPAAKRAPSRSVPVQSIGDRETPTGQSGERRPALPLQVWRFLLLFASRVRSTRGELVASPVPIAAPAAPGSPVG